MTSSDLLIDNYVLIYDFNVYAIHFFLSTPKVADVLPVVLVCCPLTLRPQ